jgi:predicted dehydrogenase
LRAGRRRKRFLTRRVEVTDPRPGVPVFDSVADLANSGADAITVGLFYERFARAVRGDGPVPVNPWDAVATATVLDAARGSAAEGRSVDVPAVAR